MVWGSGLLRPEHLVFAKRGRNVRYLAVRGPRTYDALKSIGIDCPQVFGDSAQLLSLLFEDDITKVHEVGIFPHFSHLPYFQKEFGSSSIRIINTEQLFPQVIKDILSCKAILSTSLHGLIIAEAYGLPALLVVDKNPLHGSLFKFEDYFHGTGRDPLFRQIASQKLGELTDLAYQAKRPIFDHANLLRAFPFDTHIEKNRKFISALSEPAHNKLHLHQLSKHILANPYVRHG
jgi:pyruvyltransferase